MVGSLRAGLAAARALVARLPWWAEFLLVVGIAFGFAMWDSTAWLLATGGTVGPEDDAGLYWIVRTELALAAVVAVVLALRGWRWGDLNLRATWRLTTGGLLLFALDYGLTLAADGPALALFGEPVDEWSVFDELNGPGVSLRGALALASVNPLFEETFAVAYVVRALEPRRGIAAAIVVSALIRALYHTYAGLAWGAVMFLYGLVHASVYARWRRLWPLVVAHAVANFGYAMRWY